MAVCVHSSSALGPGSSTWSRMRQATTGSMNDRKRYCALRSPRNRPRIRRDRTWRVTGRALIRLNCNVFRHMITSQCSWQSSSSSLQSLALDGFSACPHICSSWRIAFATPNRTVAKSPGNFETGIRDRIEGAAVADEMLDTSDITGMGDQHRAGLLQANALLQLRGGSYPNCFNGDIRRRRRPAVLTTCPLGSVAVDSLGELRPRFATEVAEPGCEGDHRDRDR
jgi:hypothetical protein